MNTLIKVRLQLDTEIVVENVYEMDPQKAAISAFWANHRDILLQSDPKITVIGTIASEKDLPKGWNSISLPWLPAIAYASRHQERKIKDFLVKEEPPKLKKGKKGKIYECKNSKEIK